MKAGWRTKRLGDIANIELGRTPARSNGSLWDPKRKSNNVWLSIADLLNSERNVVQDSKEYVSDEGAALCKLVRKGTLLVSFKLTLGRLAFAGRDLYTNEAIAALSLLDERCISKEFLFWFLQYFDWVKAAESDVKLKGLTLNKAKLQELKIHFPDSLDEQHRIVAILDAAFAEIATAKANAEKNLQNAHALFESYLNKIFTERGDGWVEKAINDVCVIGDGNHSSNYPRKEELVDVGVPFIRATNLIEGRVSGDDMRFLSQEKHEKLKKGHLKTGDILLTNRGEIGKTAIVDSVFDGANLNSQIAWLRCGEEIESEYLFHAINSPEIQSHFRSAKTGTALQQFTIRQIKELKISMPPKPDQNRVVDKLNSLRAEVGRLESIYQQKLAALDDLKKSLLHQAFSGAL